MAGECVTGTCARLISVVTQSDTGAKALAAAFFAREALDPKVTLNTAAATTALATVTAITGAIQAATGDLSAPLVLGGPSETRAARLARYAAVLDDIATLVQDGARGKSTDRRAGAPGSSPH